MINLKQPTLGILSAIIVIIFSLSVSSSFEPSFFGSWVTLILISMVPVQIIMTLYMQNKIITPIDKLKQPINGLVRTIIMVIFGLIVFEIIQVLFEGQGKVPTPFSIMYSINTVILTFWLVVVFGGWPFRLIKNKILSSIFLLIGTMILSYIMFKTMYNFSDFIPAPFYNDLLDPKGLFPAWNILSFVVTTLAVILAWVLLDFFPLGPKPENPILRILAVGIPVLILSYVMWKVGIDIAGDPVKYMVNIAIAIIFGEFVVLLMMETAPVQTLAQPIKGIVLIFIACVIAYIFNIIYTTVILSLYPDMPSGSPTFGLEMWTASAMLAVTFPTFVLFSQLFNFWPFRKNEISEEN